MRTREILRAKESDIQDIDTLLCSAQEPIGLSQIFCSSEKRPKRLEWIQEKLTHKLLWIIRDGDGLGGVLILEQDLKERIVGIAYIVVAERMRGQKNIGPKLVEKAQTLANIGPLRAEARNDYSRRLLVRCGFQATQDASSSGHPILVWSCKTSKSSNLKPVSVKK
jgi:N-acetylglutamate synthase-like GNAT family acetyltransferase